MTDRPIIFSTPMARALLDGRKTQTRRLLKPQPSKPWGSAFQDGNRWWTGDSLTGDVIETWKLRYAIGDRLYVREAATWVSAWGWRYRADNDDLAEKRAAGEVGKWMPSIHMPRWASRLTLTVTDVRVQRLQDISEADAVTEGIQVDPETGGFWGANGGGICDTTARFINARMAFRDLWNSLHGADAWDVNPWVVALTFTVQRGNIDAAYPPPARLLPRAGNSPDYVGTPRSGAFITKG